MCSHVGCEGAARALGGSVWITGAEVCRSAARYLGCTRTREKRVVFGISYTRQERGRPARRIQCGRVRFAADVGVPTIGRVSHRGIADWWSSEMRCVRPVSARGVVLRNVLVT